MRKFLLLLSLSFFSLFANAYEVEQVCAKYQANYGWSNGYNVEAIIADGDELAEKFNCFNCFSPLNTYVVIFWNNGGYSIIDLRSSIFALTNEGVDQNGRLWEISQSISCF